MSLQQIVKQQYRALVNKASQQTASLNIPNEGWIVTVRKALGMSGAQLARRRGISRAQVSKLEKTELDGSVTIGTMQKMAEAMECRFVYAIVPKDEIEEVIDAQAQKKARKLVSKAGQHMALEAQSLSNEQMRYEGERIAQELKARPPKDFWDE